MIGDLLNLVLGIATAGAGALVLEDLLDRRAPVPVRAEEPPEAPAESDESA
jgi:hypothetical protein